MLGLKIEKREKNWEGKCREKMERIKVEKKRVK